MSTRLCILLLLICCHSLPVAAQRSAGGGASGSAVAGKVLDQGTGQPVEFANIALHSAADSSLVTGGTTDASGSFRVKVAPGQYYAVISFISYRSHSTEAFRVGEGLYDLGTVALSVDAETLQEVEVTGQALAMEMKLDRRVFNVGQELTTVGGSASDLLDQLPGINIDVDGNVNMRGSSNVRILIDGRPSSLISGSPEALELLQSDLIERVEVITNPSARYDAEGEVGIINIILKKQQDKGLNGSFSTTVGWPTRATGSYTINYRRKWVNLFSSLGLAYRKNPGMAYSEQRNFTGEPPLFITDRDFSREDIRANMQVGADFYLSDDNSDVLTLALSGFVGTGDNLTDITYTDLDLAGTVLDRRLRDEDQVEDEENITLNLDYVHKFRQEDHKLSMDLQLRDDNDREDSDIVESNLESGTADLFQQVGNTENEANARFSVDYQRPVAEVWMLEAGGRASLRHIENDYLVEEGADPNNLTPIAEFQEDFEFVENIFAAYAIVGHDPEGPWSWQAGVRSEYTGIETREQLAGNVNPRDFLNLFPSAHLSYNLGEGQDLQISYSRRINRPGFRLLLPFSNFSDRRALRLGNPNLNPEFSDSYELTWLRNTKTNSVLVDIYYRQRRGLINRVSTINADGVVVSRPINLSTQESVGVDVNYSQDLFPWWNMNVNVNAYGFQNRGSFEGQDLNNEAITLTTRTRQQLDLGEKTTAQLSFFYRAPYQDVQGTSYSFWALSAGASRDVMNDKGTFTLSASDVFNTQRYRGLTITEDFERYGEYQRQFTTVRLTFTYRLNEQKRRGEAGDEGMGDFGSDGPY